MKDSRDIHRVLARQLRRLGITDPERAPTDAAWLRLLAEISATYGDGEDDRALLERALEISSVEMEELQASLRGVSESRVARERDRLRAIVEALDDGICVVDPMGQVLSLNRAARQFLGAREGVLLGELLGERLLLRAEGSPEPTDGREALAAVLRGGQPLRFDDSILLREGRSPAPLACTLTPLLASGDHDIRGGVGEVEGEDEGERACKRENGENKPLGALFLLHDLTERRRTEFELRQLADALRSARDRALEANHAKTAFLANISHELRTPLNAIIGYSELISEEIDEFLDKNLDEVIGEDNRRIHQAANHLLLLITDVLDFSKIEAGKMAIEVLTFDVTELLAAVTSVIEPLIHQGNNRLLVALDPEVKEMRSDRTKLKQALFNLLSNAAKFTKDGSVYLEVHREARPPRPPRLEVGSMEPVEPVEPDQPRDLLVFTVRDTGIGIPEDRLVDLFEAFTQVDPSTSRVYGGTGLGLTITREFCHLLGGEIEVESVLGEGSTFRLRLPADLGRG